MTAANPSPGAIRLVVFDLDGTLTRPYLDFRRIRSEIQTALAGEYRFPIEEPLLERILELPDAPRTRALGILHAHEDRAAARAERNDGAAEILEWLRSRGRRSAVLTRNRRAPTLTVLEKLGLAPDAVATRDDGPLKPDPRSVLALVRRFGSEPAETLVVGDFRHDIEAGRGAGTRTCLLTNGAPPRFAIEADHTVERLAQLPGLPGLREGLPR